MNTILKLYAFGFWTGFHEKSNSLHIGFFLSLFQNVFNCSIEVGKNIQESDILLETVFEKKTYLFDKKWKYSFLFSGESSINHPLRYTLNYSCVLCGQRNHKNTVNMPLYIPYLHCSQKYERMLRLSNTSRIPPLNILAVVSNANASFRNYFLEMLQKFIPIHYAGQYKNNVPKINSGYETQEFQDLVSQYKIIISMENTQEDTYISEKISHGFLSGTIPVYWGSPRVTDYFNKDRFIHVKSFIDIDRAILQIKEVCNDSSQYLNMIHKPAFASSIDPRPLSKVIADIRNVILPKPFQWIDKIYILNSPEFEPKSHKRLLKMFVDDLKIPLDNLVFISPTYKHTITAAMFKTHVKKDLSISTYRRKPTTKSELSLTLNYKAAMQSIVQNYKEGMFLVFESDVFLREASVNLSRSLDFFHSIKDRWDLIHFGYDGGDKKDGIYGAPYIRGETLYRSHKLPDSPYLEDITTPSDEIRLIRKFHTRCADSFVWTFSGVVKFLQHMETDTNYGAPFDYYLTNFLELNNRTFNHYWSNVQFFVQGSNHGMVPSTIQRDQS